MLIAGLSAGARDGSAAVADGARLVGVCPQERITRTRGAGVNRTGLPDEALDAVLARMGRSRADVARYVAANGAPSSEGERVELLDHHFAHACTAYLSSPFSSAAIVVCDHEAPHVSVWKGDGAAVAPVDLPWNGPGFSDIYSRCAAAFGFTSPAGGQRLEALARLSPDGRDDRVDQLIRLGEASLDIPASFEATLSSWLSGDGNPASPARARLAAALQARIADLFLELLQRVRAAVGDPRLCLGGSLAHHSAINTRVKTSVLFDEVFVPVDPGNAGLAVGAALHAAGGAPADVSPFLGPNYSVEETKVVLDNCKLQYSLERDDEVIDEVVRTLRQGRLVAWFDGAMEWGPRALGARCILASPQSPYVLENLNRFLKQRDPWRGYALSGLADAVPKYFEGPAAAPFMECDYRPLDPGLFRAVLPSADAAARVHTVGEGAQPRFVRLLEAFADATGLPFLVNTSFNGFHEPIVCTPRDAVRVFYGSGIDLLALGQFVLAK